MDVSFKGGGDLFFNLNILWCHLLLGQDQMCLMVANILEYVPVKKDLQLTAGTGHKLRLAYSPAMGLYLGIYMHAPKRGQVWNTWHVWSYSVCGEVAMNSSSLFKLFTSASMSPVVSAEMVGFVLMCGLKDHPREVRMKGCREFKGIWKEKLTKNQQENKFASLWKNGVMKEI